MAGIVSRNEKDLIGRRRVTDAGSSMRRHGPNIVRGGGH
jgi:hypothetical protein